MGAQGGGGGRRGGRWWGRGVLGRGVGGAGWRGHGGGPAGRGAGRTKGQQQVPPPQTFVVVPHADLPHAAQAVRGGNLEDVQAVAMESSVPIQVPVAAPAVCPVQHDAHVCCGT